VPACANIPSYIAWFMLGNAEYAWIAMIGSFREFLCPLRQ
jgi:hypothetical protein